MTICTVPWTSPLLYWFLPDLRKFFINGELLLWLSGGERPLLSRSWANTLKWTLWWAFLQRVCHQLRVLLKTFLKLLSQWLLSFGCSVELCLQVFLGVLHLPEMTCHFWNTLWIVYSIVSVHFFSSVKRVSPQRHSPPLILKLRSSGQCKCHFHHVG